MKLYYLSCPQCKWESKQPVTEGVMRRFMREVRYCLVCRQEKRPQSEFKMREVIINVAKKGR